MSEPASLRLDPNVIWSGGSAAVVPEVVPEGLLAAGTRSTLRLVEVNESGRDPVRMAEFTLEFAKYAPVPAEVSAGLIERFAERGRGED